MKKLLDNERILMTVDFTMPIVIVKSALFYTRLKSKIKTIRFMGISISWVRPGLKKRPEVEIESGWLKAKREE